MISRWSQRILNNDLEGAHLQEWALTLSSVGILAWAAMLALAM